MVRRQVNQRTLIVVQVFIAAYVAALRSTCRHGGSRTQVGAVVNSSKNDSDVRLQRWWVLSWNGSRLCFKWNITSCVSHWSRGDFRLERVQSNDVREHQ